MEKNIDPRQINILVYAYIGDSIYEVKVREHIVKMHPTLKVNKLHNIAVKYVRAKSQSDVVRYLHDEEILSEDEWDIVLRGRNSAHNPPKNAVVSEYNYATGYEALIGYLYIKKETERLEEILNYSINYIDEKLSGGYPLQN